MRTTHTSTECLTGNHRDSSAATTRSQDQGPIKSDINTDSIDIWIAMLWKDLELEFEKNMSKNFG